MEIWKKIGELTESRPFVSEIVLWVVLTISVAAMLSNSIPPGVLYEAF